MSRRNRNGVGTRDFWQTADTNKQSYIFYFNRLKELAISMFEWKNLPETVDPRFLELALFNEGMSVFFKDDVIGFLSLRTMIGGKLNLYQIPTMRTAYASNGYNKPLDENNSVIIFNNMIHSPSAMEMELYAKRLWDIDRTVDTNVKAQKTPILITCDETQRLTMKNLYMQYDGNMPVIYADKNISPNSIKVLQTGAPYLADRLASLKTQIWNEALTYLGISNVNIVKKERLISDEVLRNQGGTVASRYSSLNSRKQACEQINKMFGLNIDVEYRDSFDTLQGLTSTNPTPEESDNLE